MIFVSLLILMELIGVLSFLFLHKGTLRYRKRIRGFMWENERHDFFSIKTNEPLSVKFQIEKTLQITKIFLPIVISKCVIRIASLLLQTFLAIVKLMIN